MALSDVYPKGTLCPTCNKDLNAVIAGLDNCIPCLNEGEKTSAKKSVLAHFGLALLCIFNFRFRESIAEFLWSIERLFKIGDYHPIKGLFYKRGYLK